MATEYPVSSRDLQTTTNRHQSLTDLKTVQNFRRKYQLPSDLVQRNPQDYQKRQRSKSLALNQPYNGGGRRGSLLQQKEAAMVGETDYSQKMLSLKQTLTMMGQNLPGMMNTGSKTTGKPRAQPGLKRASLVRSMSKKKVSLLEELGIIAEDTDDEGLMSSRGPMSDSDSCLGASRRSLHGRHRKKRSRIAAKFKRLAKFLTIFFGLWKIHALKVKHFLDTYVDLIEINEPVDLLFDVTEFKADKQACVSQETKRILKKNPKDRTEEEVKYVQVALRNYSSIAEYPIRMTRRLAERAWYEILDRKRIIIQQTHPARCFYFILSGSVVVSKMDEEYGVSRTVCFLNRGEHFGELGLINNAPRQASVISKETVELLVINDEDYVDIFMGGGLKGPGDDFIEHLWCFDGWPIDILPDYPSDSFLSYFKRNMVLVHDSNISEWIYIVKTGSCTVIKKLVEVSPQKQRLEKSKKDEDEDQDAEERHRQLMEMGFKKAKLKSEVRSLMFRQKELAELKMGVDMRAVQKSAWEPDLPALEPPENFPQYDTTDGLEDDQSNPSSDHNRQRRKSIALLLQPKKKVSITKPYIQPSSAPTPGTDNETEPVETMVSKSPPPQPVERKRKKSVIRVGGSPNRKLSNAVLTKAAMPSHPPAIREEAGGPTSNNSAKPPEEDEETKKIRAEFDAIINSDSSYKKQPLKEEKKTILDELNKDYLKSSHGGAPEDLRPMFVRVQTLTKGAIFGLGDLVHDGQPSLSLVSNGAECIVIRKKFYLEHCKQGLLNKIRQEVSPYPDKHHIQENLQTYVNWANNKETAVNETLLWNRMKKLDVHNARSSLALRQSMPERYRVSLAQ